VAARLTSCENVSLGLLFSPLTLTVIQVSVIERRSSYSSGLQTGITCILMGRRRFLACQ